MLLNDLNTITMQYLFIILLSWPIFANCDQPKIPKVVETALVQYQTISKNLHVIGTLKANKFSNLLAETSGKLDIIEERKNSYVKKDQVIAKLENKVLASQVSLATATRDLAKSNVDRLTKLLQLDSASKHLLDEAEEKLLKIGRAHV